MNTDRGKFRFSHIPSQETNEKCFEKQITWEIEQSTQPYPFLLSKRFLLLILLFSGCLFAVIVRVCINIAIVEMTSNKTTTIGNKTIHEVEINSLALSNPLSILLVFQPAAFNWSSKETGIILSSHPSGYLFSIFGAYAATKFGGSVTYGGLTLAMSVLTALNPIFLQWGFHIFIASRILAGFVDGVAYASTAEIFSRWIPTSERSRFMSIISTGRYISVAVSYPICGYVAFYWGWEMIFYLAGGACSIWSVIWLIIVRNEPSEDKLISKKELSYILSQTETSPRNEITHPYKKILTSAPVWALGASQLTYSIGFSILITYLPQYIKDMTQRQINEIGAIASIPNFICIIITPIVGALMDYLQNNHNLKPSLIHKILMTFGYITGSILFAVAAFTTDFTLSMTCSILINIFLSFNFLILQLICIYMAPKHSSILLGMTTGWFVIGHIIVPTTVGLIVVNHTVQEWNLCYLLSAGVLMVGAFVYLIYGSSELQPWAASPDQDKNSELPDAINNNRTK